MTVLSFYTVAFIALILLIAVVVFTGIYLVFRTYNRRKQQAYIAEWQVDRRQRE